MDVGSVFREGFWWEGAVVEVPPTRVGGEPGELEIRAPRGPMDNAQSGE